MNRTLAVIALVASGPAWADTAPRVVPLHDVAVAYRVSGPATDAIPFLSAGGNPVDMRLSWDTARQRLLVTAAGRSQRLLVDLPAHGSTLLEDSAHIALALPMRDTDVQALTMANARFTRRGQAVVAGEGCTEWSVQSNRSTGTVCLTPDGVPLRGEGDVNGRHGQFVATAIDRGAVNPADFVVPAGYNRLELPRFGGK